MTRVDDDTPRARRSAARRASRLGVRMFVLFYLAPVIVAACVWLIDSKPMSWRAADWSSAGILPAPTAGDPAEIRVYVARTGSWKGIVSVHSWILLKAAGAERYERYEVVGWGSPVRRDAHAADGRWYSNAPELVGMVSGARAAALIPDVQAAIADYPYATRGSYRIWPGPNSNSFVAHILQAVPALGLALPPTAIGKDFPVNGRIFNLTGEGTGVFISLGGVICVRAGLRDGFELGLFGLVAGIDVLRPALKLPGLGRLGFAPRAA